jgi:hypothetical protein
MDQVEAAKRSAGVAALFDRVADTYENVGIPWFGPIAEALVREVGARPGQRALDIGTFTDAEHWRAWSMSHGQRGSWEAVPAGERDEVMAEATRRLAAAADGDGDGRITFTQGIRLTIAEL